MIAWIERTLRKLTEKYFYIFVNLIVFLEPSRIIKIPDDWMNSMELEDVF